jgi:hypothetical protein
MLLPLSRRMLTPLLSEEEVIQLLDAPESSERVGPFLALALRDVSIHRRAVESETRIVRRHSRLTDERSVERMFTACQLSNPVGAAGREPSPTAWEIAALLPQLVGLDRCRFSRWRRIGTEFVVGTAENRAIGCPTRAAAFVRL